MLFHLHRIPVSRSQEDLLCSSFSDGPLCSRRLLGKSQDSLLLPGLMSSSSQDDAPLSSTSKLPAGSRTSRSANHLARRTRMSANKPEISPKPLVSAHKPNTRIPCPPKPGLSASKTRLGRGPAGGACEVKSQEAQKGARGSRTLTKTNTSNDTISPMGSPSVARRALGTKSVLTRPQSKTDKPAHNDEKSGRIKGMPASKTTDTNISTSEKADNAEKPSTIHVDKIGQNRRKSGNRQVRTTRASELRRAASPNARNVNSNPSASVEPFKGAKLGERQNCSSPARQKISNIPTHASKTPDMQKAGGRSRIQAQTRYRGAEGGEAAQLREDMSGKAGGGSGAKSEDSAVSSAGEVGCKSNSLPACSRTGPEEVHRKSCSVYTGQRDQSEVKRPGVLDRLRRLEKPSESSG